MKSFSFCIIALLYTSTAFGWGATGHRVVGQIAENHLNKKAKKALQEILGHESLAVSSVWMDDIKSDDAFDHTHDWHWVTIPGGMTYEQAEKNPNGDVIATIERIISELETGKLTREEQKEHVRMLTHLVGDIHQPLHVGTGEDRGGNDVKVTWFRESSNLHRVWDSDMIDSQQFSYTELAKAIDHASKEQIKAWQDDTVRQWAYESMSYRSQVYDVPEDGNIGYRYRYKNWELVQQRLHQAGVRLAGVLNKIYG